MEAKATVGGKIMKMLFSGILKHIPCWDMDVSSKN